MESRYELTHTFRETLKNYFRQLDWPLLVFLVLFLNVKLYVKITAIVIAIIWRGRPFLPKGKLPRWWGFYAAMIALGLVNLLLSIPSLSSPALYAFGLGCLYWLLALLAAGQIYLFVQNGDKEKLHPTVTTFFLLNAVCMLGSFVQLCLEAGVLNPYNYEGEHRKYFISTGDRIIGIGMDSSVTAALICAFGLLYFLYRGKRGSALLCWVAMLLATSNTVDILLGIVLVFCFFFYTDRIQKSMILVFLLLMVVFFSKISPSNNRYTGNLLKRVAGKDGYLPPMQIPHAKWNEFVEDKAVAAKENKLLTFMKDFYLPGQTDTLIRMYKGWDLSGRRIAFLQLRNFYQQHPARLLLGTGMGNFSSRLAMRTTALGIEGNYPAKERYIHPYFRDNFLFIYLYYHIRDEGQHSVINKPDSVYGQLLTEYGLAGLACFFFFYLLFFVRPVRGLWSARSYGLPLLLLMAGAFFTEYWFEQLSVVVLFELLMLLDKKNIVSHAT